VNGRCRIPIDRVSESRQFDQQDWYDRLIQGLFEQQQASGVRRLVDPKSPERHNVRSPAVALFP
jgi:hypothetical protein